MLINYRWWRWRSGDCRGGKECCRNRRRRRRRRRTAWFWWQGSRCSVCWRRSRGRERVEYRRGVDRARPRGRNRIQSLTRCRPWARPRPHRWRSYCGGSSSSPCGGATPRRGRRPATTTAAWRAATPTAEAAGAGAGTEAAAAPGCRVPTWAWKTTTGTAPWCWGCAEVEGPRTIA